MEQTAGCERPSDIFANAGAAGFAQLSQTFLASDWKLFEIAIRRLQTSCPKRY
jgi:hypothetical protein